MPKSKSPAPESAPPAVDEAALNSRLKSMAAAHLKTASASLSDASGLHHILGKLGAADAGSAGRLEAISAARAAIAKLESWAGDQSPVEPVPDRDVEPTESWARRVRRPATVDPAATLIDPNWAKRR